MESVLNGRNAAMFINIECKKRMWELEFEEVSGDCFVHITLIIMLVMK